MIYRGPWHSFKNLVIVIIIITVIDPTLEVGEEAQQAGPRLCKHKVASSIPHSGHVRFLLQSHLENYHCYFFNVTTGVEGRWKEERGSVINL